MVFSTIAFLFQFLPIFLLAYYATPQKYRNITLVIGSLVFYAIGSGWYTLLLLLSLLINYGLSCMISGTHARHPESAKHYLIAGLIYNFGLLVVFKYLRSYRKEAWTISRSVITYVSPLTTA